MKLVSGLGAGALVAVPLIAAPPVVAQTPAATPPAVAVCRTCHTFEKGGRNGIGPNLHGIAGRAAGLTPGFNYSPALKASNLRWDEATLDEYLTSPLKKVPGSRMPLSTPDPAKRAVIIAYLRSQGAK